MNARLRWRALWCALALTLLILPNIAAVVVPFERWPLTCGPMYAENPAARVRYRSSFVLEHRDGSTTTLATRKALGLSEWQFRRAFLVVGWGADNSGGFVADAVREDVEADDARAARVAAFFDGVAAAAQQKKKQRRAWRDVVAIRVDVSADVSTDVSGEGGPLWGTPVLLGRYRVDERRFDIDRRWRARL